MVIQGQLLTQKAFDHFFIQGDNATPRIPKVLVCLILLISILPYVLIQLGFDFGNHPVPLTRDAIAHLSDSQIRESMFASFSGEFIHTILEWSAFTIAIFTMILAFTHYRLTRDLTTLIIGIAFLSTGVIDAFHTLAVDRLVSSVGRAQDLAPFTWAISRIFNASIMIVGVGIILLKGLEKSQLTIRTVTLVSLLFGILAYGIINYCATNSSLPQTIFPEGFVSRPYDLIPLFLFVFSFFYLYPRLYRASPSIFAHSLLLSALIQIIVGFHMAFGSIALFDSHFNVAHFLKIIGYFVPFVGLVLDYVRTYKISLVMQEQLAERTKELEDINNELDDFAYIAAHDLKEPLRGIHDYSQFLLEDYEKKLGKDGSDKLHSLMSLSKCMGLLIDNLSECSRVGRVGLKLKKNNLNRILDSAILMLGRRIDEENAVIKINGALPEIVCDESMLQQVFVNLISNAIKYNKSEQKTIEVGFLDEAFHKHTTFYVKDNGIGINEKHHDVIFRIFKRLHGRDMFGGGSGAGLTITKKIIEVHDGKIWVESSAEKGTCIWFTLSNELEDGK